MNIVLIGFMGTGKSSVGKLLATRLNLVYFSTDNRIVELTGKSINEIFELYGEPYFRELERKVIEDISSKTSYVIDTGGGCVLDEKNIVNLRKNGYIINLRVRLEVIIDRLKEYQDRPLLKGEKEKKIKSLLKSREKYYDNADFFIDTSNLNIEDIVTVIEKRLGQLNNKK